MKKPLIIANWKMNMTVVKAVAFVHRFRDLVQLSNATIILCAPFTSLSSLRYEINKGTAGFSMQLKHPLFLGAQNIFYLPEGAYTGEISPAMIKELADYVLIGHSERRSLFHETDEEAHRKMRAAQDVGLTPILCVGSFVGQKEGTISHFVEKELEQQLKNCLTGLSFDKKQKLVLAYEPPHAIGTGAAADPQRINHVCYFIRRQLDQMFGAAVAIETKVLYGGSVTSKNAKDFLQQKEIDGLLVGTASLDVEEFARIVKNC